MSGSTQVPFEPGQVLLVGASRGGATRWLQTLVRRVDASLVWVDGAPEGQPALDVQPGETVTCQTWRYMDALYQAEARVALVGLEPEPLVGLTILSSTRVQQREYVRVPLTVEASAVRLGSPGAAVEDMAPPRPFRLQVRDLSAGGLRGRCGLPLAPGDEIEIELPLPPATGGPAAPLRLRGRVMDVPDRPEPLNVRARVVRLVETGAPGDLACEIGVAFVDVPKELRERIIRFALDVQRDRRRRGML